MKNGINLATRPLRGRRWMLAATGMLVVAALVASAVHLAVFLRGSRAVGELKEELAGIDARRGKLADQIEASRTRMTAPPAQKLIGELVAIDTSGITQVVPPAQVLRELARMMPVDARTLSVELETSLPEQVVRLEVVSDSTVAAESLLEGMSQSPWLTEAEILDERHGTDGDIYLRVSAKLALPGEAQ